MERLELELIFDPPKCSKVINEGWWLVSFSGQPVDFEIKALVLNSQLRNASPCSDLLFSGTDQLWRSRLSLLERTILESDKRYCRNRMILIVVDITDKIIYIHYLECDWVNSMAGDKVT